MWFGLTQDTQHSLTYIANPLDSDTAIQKDARVALVKSTVGTADREHRLCR